VLADGRQLKVRCVIFGGEAIYPGRLSQWNEKYPDCRLINLYGITETTVHVTMKEITNVEIAANKSNIGRPIPTIQVFILDKYLNLVPQGVPGELCISGKGLSRGYLNRPDLTQERFVHNPFMPGELMYRSGDLVRMDANGEIEYIARIDQQVKIRGHRIEPAEIRNHLLKHPAIDACEIVASTDAQGEKCLCAYFIKKHAVKPQVLREFLQQFLPPYMIPAYFMEIGVLPLTSNGKLKLSELPKPVSNVLNDYVAPKGNIEERLIDLWTMVLKLDKVGVHDNFFEVGGNSLSLVKLSEMVKGSFDVTDPVVALFKYPTVRSFAQYLSGAGDVENDEMMAAEELMVEQSKSRFQKMRL
jgi:acyl-coenzyme A synthetase/AMP-(fatty) acid ligase